MDWNEHNIVYLQFSLSSPSACVSPSDPTLTVENVTEVMGKVGNWEWVARGNCRCGLGIPDFKLQEIKQQSYTKRDRSRLAGEYWINTDPNASWRRLANVLYEQGEDSALLMVKQYLPKGMYISCLPEIGLVFRGVHIRLMHTNTHWPTCVVIVYSIHGYCTLVHMYLLLHMTIITLWLPCKRHDLPPHTHHGRFHRQTTLYISCPKAMLSVLTTDFP